MSDSKRLTTSAGAPIADNQNSLSAGPRGPLLLQDYQLLEKLAHQNRERIPERVVHAKGWGAHGIFTVTHDINSASLLSTRMILLKEGTVAFTGTPEEVMRNDMLEPVYGKHFLFTDHPATGRPVIVPEDIEL